MNVARAVRLNFQATGKDDLWSAFLDIAEWKLVYYNHRQARLADEAVALPDLAVITGHDALVPF